MVTAIAACGKHQRTQNHVRAKTPDHTSIIMTKRPSQAASRGEGRMRMRLSVIVPARHEADVLPPVTVLDPDPLQPGWTGKANAVWTAAKKARGEWLLFTDADTIHTAGNLRRAIHEAQHEHVVMLSYSPRQVVTGFWQRALMPLVFSELALAYPPEKVSDTGSR